LLDINTSVKENSSVDTNDSVDYVEMCNKCLEFEAELIKQHNMVEKDEYNRLSKTFSELEQHCISLEIAMQLNKENFQKNNTSVNQTEPSFDQLFELNNLKAELQTKDTTIEKLKTNIKRLNKTSTTNNVKKDIDEIETINIELEHRSVEITDLNAQLQKKVFVITTLKNDLRKFKGKDIVDNAAQVSNATTIAPGMSKSTDNTKNDRILKISSNTQKKNKVEDHSRIVKSSLNKSNFVVEPSRNANVQHSKLNTNSELMYVKCNSSMFDARHELCFVEFIADMNASSKSKSVKKAKKKEEWKPTGKVFTKIGYNWRPT
ncbi:hypothetical protein Tco_0157097, partial [Tanacetum coccineum]